MIKLINHQSFTLFLMKDYRFQNNKYGVNNNNLRLFNKINHKLFNKINHKFSINNSNINLNLINNKSNHNHNKSIDKNKFLKVFQNLNRK